MSYIILFLLAIPSIFCALLRVGNNLTLKLHSWEKNMNVNIIEEFEKQHKWTNAFNM